MMRKTALVACLIGALVLLPWLGARLVQAQEGEEPDVVLSGLNGPQGVLVAPDGTVWAIDSGLGGEDETDLVDPVSGEVVAAQIGDTARVVRTTADGGQEDVVSLPSVIFGDEFVGGARLALLDGELYATTGFWTGFEDNRPAAQPGMASIMRIADGEATEVINLSGIERRMNPDGTVYESSPYGLAAGPDDKLWVADAGANTLLRVDPDTQAVELLTVFPALPGAFPNPTRGGELLTDPVPTGVTFDDEGNAYVSFLSGAPFVPGSAKVVQMQNGARADYATGLTMLTDIRTAPNGDLFAVQFAVFTEQGPQLNSGAIVRVLEGEDSEVVLDGLSFPTSIDFNEDGDAYIAINGVGPPGSGAVIRVAGLMDAEAVAVAAVGEEMVEEDVTEEEAAEEAVEEEAAEEEAADDEAVDDEAADEHDMAEMAEDDGSSVAISDQASDGMMVTVDSVTAEQTGWMVIHLDAEGRPGPVIGHTAVPAGTTDNVIIFLEEDIFGETTLWAMLHIDEGQPGVYEFPGPDVPARVNDQVVMAAFVADAPEMAEDEVEATEEAVEDEVVAEEEDDEAVEVAEETGSIIDIIVDDEDFSTLVAALTVAGLVDALEGEGPFTLFAPNNAAFAALPTGVIDALLEDPTGDLTQVLLYHVAPGLVLDNDLYDGLQVQALQGGSVTITIDEDDNAIVDDATIITPDIMATNGIIHVIDAVLIPPAEEEMVEEELVEEEMVEEEAEAVATPVAEEEPEAVATPVAEEEPAAVATPVSEEEPEAVAIPAAEEEPTAVVTPVAEEEAVVTEAPAALPATGGSGASTPLAVGVVLLVVAALGLSVWREKRVNA